MSSDTVGTVHHLMSASEIGELLAVSRQRVDQIAKSDPTFPEPVAVLSGIRVFESADVERWASLPGHRRAVRFIGALDDLHRYRVHVAGREECVAIPRNAVLHEPLLEWARRAEHLITEANRFDEAMVFVPLRQWDERIDMAGRIK